MPMPSANADQAVEPMAGYASLRRLFAFVVPLLPRLVAVLLMTLALTGGSMVLPKIAGDVIDSASGPGWQSRIDRLGLGLLALVVAMSVLRFLSSYWLGWASGKLLLALREHMFGQLLRLSAAFFQRRQVGELNARVMSNVEVMQDIITFDVLNGVQSVVSLVGVTAILFALSLQLMLVAALAIAPFLLASVFFGKRLERAALRKNDAFADSSAKLDEVIGGISTVQSFNQEAAERRRFSAVLQRLFERQLWQAKLASAYSALSDFFALGALMVVIWYGSRLIAAGRLTVGELTACMMYMFIFANSIESVGKLFNRIKELSGYSHRFFQLLDEIPDIANRGTLVPERLAPATIEFEAVSFAYPVNRGKRVLDALSLRIEAGEVVALVGPSGSGKSTLFKLLLRLHDPDSGVIRLAGQPHELYELGALRNVFGLVSQEIYFFSGTVLDNIRYGNAHASHADVLQALEAVAAADFVKTFARGLEEPVGVGGSRLSVGQKQRLGLARMYLKNPRILLLDEATSALDSESEAKVQDGLRRLKQGRTTLMIAHRLSTAREADRIVMLDNGCIIADGDHASLQRHCGLYERYWRWQADEGSQSRNPAAPAA